MLWVRVRARTVLSWFVAFSNAAGCGGSVSNSSESTAGVGGKTQANGASGGSGAGGVLAAAGGNLPVADQMVLVPAGTFLMGLDAPGSDTQPVHSVSVDAFSMDVSEVTVAAYQACVEDGKCTPAIQYPAEDNSCNAGAALREQHPINCLDLAQAAAYCGWKGKRLPTEAEWEYAARGTDGRLYPWGNEVANGSGCWTTTSLIRGSTCPVGQYANGASPFGVMDMIGNVYEWTSSLYATDYTYQIMTEYQVVRGSAWNDVTVPTAAHRDRALPTATSARIGMRCVRDP
jgi:eukaryotic-like serine/threonine-protein kinase